MSMKWKFAVIVLLTLVMFLAAGSAVFGNRSVVDAKGSAQKRLSLIHI